MKNIELIDQYFNNSLSPKEQKHFNKLLQNDESFKTEFLFQKDLKKAVINHEQNNLKNNLRSFEKNITHKQSFAVIHKKWLVAASIILLVGLSSILIKTNYYPSSKKLYTENFEPYRNIVFPIVRGEVSYSIEYSAFMAYENGNFHKAINLFNSIENQNSAHIAFYKAMCYLSLNKIDEAINLLEPISQKTYSIQPNKKLSQKSHWYLGLAYLKSGNDEKARSSLLKVISQPCNACRKKTMAQEIIKHIN